MSCLTLHGAGNMNHAHKPSGQQGHSNIKIKGWRVSQINVYWVPSNIPGFFLVLETKEYSKKEKGFVLTKLKFGFKYVKHRVSQHGLMILCKLGEKRGIVRMSHNCRKREKLNNCISGNIFVITWHYDWHKESLLRMSALHQPWGTQQRHMSSLPAGWARSSIPNAK